MENGGGRRTRWNFSSAGAPTSGGDTTIRGYLEKLMAEVDKNGGKPLVLLAHGDPSRFACFRTTPIAEDAIMTAVKSAEFNGYSSTTGIAPARCAIAEYLNKDLPYKLSPDDVYVTSGCTQAIEILLSVLARPGANILFPKPGFPFYEARAAFSNLEARHFNLIPERGWEVDLDHVEALADENTVAMVIINPGNPCGNVFTYQHLSKIAETAKKLGIMIIADEVYDHLTFGSTPFVPMGVFGQTVPVITLGSISKRWVVPGWRLGWMVRSDPNGFLKEAKIVESIESFLNISTDPATFIQGAVPHILENTKDDFFNKIIDILRQASNICYEKLKEIDCITCPNKPEGSMFVMVKLDLSYLEGITDCVDFCCKLAKEESLIILPGRENGMVDRCVPVYSSSEVIEKMQRYASSEKEHPYRAMYSSLIGGITLDPALMVIPLDDRMVHRGHGVFDTAMLINGCIYDLDSHLDRFLTSASKAKISTPFPHETLRQIILQLAASSKLKEGSIRYWLSAGPGDFSLPLPRPSQSAFYSIVIDKKFTRLLKGSKVVTSSIPMKPSMFATMKSVNYLPNVLSQLEAQETGAYASVWVDEDGCIAEGPSANIAIVSKSMELLLPLSDKILSGCTSKRLSALAMKLVDKGILKSVRTRKVTVNEARDSAEMMFVSSLTHVAPITEWDGQPIGDGRVGDLTRAISDLFWEDITEGPEMLRTPVPYKELQFLEN